MVGKSRCIVLYLIIQLFTMVVFSINLLHLENGIFVNRTSTSAWLIVTNIIMLLVTIFGIVNIRNICKMSEKEVQYKIQEAILQNIEDLNRDLCIQKHDFMNHVHIVYGLIQIDKCSEAKEYIVNTFDEIEGTRRVIKTENVVLTALLESKNKIAALRDINMYFDVHGTFAEMPIKPWEIAGVLGNLIDNAIDAVSDLTLEKGNIHISLSNSDDEYIFRINNNGPIIVEETISRIFTAGYTTKPQKGRGMGLYIVKNILDNYRGSIRVESDLVRGTTFEVSLPKVQSLQKVQNDGRGEKII